LHEALLSTTVHGWQAQEIDAVRSAGGVAEKHVAASAGPSAPLWQIPSMTLTGVLAGSGIVDQTPGAMTLPVNTWPGNAAHVTVHAEEA
jgi:hypothetical protein